MYIITNSSLCCFVIPVVSAITVYLEMIHFLQLVAWKAVQIIMNLIRYKLCQFTLGHANEDSFGSVRGAMGRRIELNAVPKHEPEGWKEGSVLFNDALNTFYLRLYGVGHMVNGHSDSERENPLPPHGLLFPISSKGYFICTIPQTG